MRTSFFKQAIQSKELKAFLSFLKSGAFILGCFLLALFFIIQGPVHNKNMNKAYEAIDEEISDRRNITAEEKVEIIDKHLANVPNYDSLAAVLLFGGMGCICYAAYHVINSEADVPTQDNEKSSQDLVDFISGKNDDLPNSKK